MEFEGLMCDRGREETILLFGVRANLDLSSPMLLHRGKLCESR